GHLESEAGDDHEREPDKREVRGAAAAPAGLVPHEQVERVDRPGPERDRHQRAHRRAVPAQADKAGDDPDRQRRQRNGDRPPGQRLERQKRWGAAEQTGGLPMLQAALLPQEETGEPRGQSESGEREREQADVEYEEEIRVLAAAAL